MKTPIYDFVKKYAESNTVRLHMPGHKGKGRLGVEAFDLTEISGADFLYGACGIISDSEANATSLFKTAHSFYSTEGSTLAIKAMLALALTKTAGDTSRPTVLAARNAHKAFINAAALLDISVEWLYPSECEHLCKCSVTPTDLRNKLSQMEKLPEAVYLTSPDYLGNMADIKGLSEVCDSFEIPLLVDNAHGAYLAFLTPSEHPIALGASMCADSAHKTLHVLTGGAYLHIAKKAEKYISRARAMLSLFASTSPSYLVLQSLDLCNEYLSDGYTDRLNITAKKLSELKEKLVALGFELEGEEKLKLVIRAEKYGYTGDELADFLRKHSIEIEFFDRDFAVMMFTPENSDSDYSRLYSALSSLARRDFIPDCHSERLLPHPSVFSIREAVFADSETVSAEESIGRVCAKSTVSCPPAIPIVVSGEIITDEDVALFKKYGITDIEVVKKYEVLKMENCNVKNAKTEEIIKKWYGRLGFSDTYDNEFEKALSEIFISDTITVEDYDCECDDGKRNLLSFLFFAEKLESDYRERGLPEKVLLDTLYDVVIWTDTWSKVKGELYLGELKWLKHHYTQKLFRIGRLQYAMGKALRDVPKYAIKKGDPIIEVHIPADGQMHPEDCRKSIEMAKAFYAKYYPDFKYEYFSCHSWLLDGSLKEYLKEGSNILEFAKLFDVLYEEDSYSLLRYIFKWDTNIENLESAECTSSFSERIKKSALNGAKFHVGYGFIKK